tara:strand:+ start:355 stop:630 length:276 start_codon:yes stop_codon:yes gene_type:complete
VKLLPQNKQFIGLDAYPRNQEDERKINANILSLFNSPTGKEVLKYFRSITIEAVHGANVTDSVLRHAEGQRYIIGLIERRMVQGHKDKQNG